MLRDARRCAAALLKHYSTLLRQRAFRFRRGSPPRLAPDPNYEDVSRNAQNLYDVGFLKLSHSTSFALVGY